MGELTGEEKVAALLAALPPDAAEAVLVRLAPGHAERLRGRLKAREPVPPEALYQAAQELVDIRRIADRPVLTPSPTESGPQAHINSPATPSHPTPPEVEQPTPESPSESLRQFTPEVLIAALKGERAPTVSLVVGCLSVPQASAVLKLLPPEVRREATLRLGQPSPLPPDLADRILYAFLARCRELASQPAQPSPDQLLARLADLARSLDRDDRKEILAQLERKDPEAAAKVRRALYSFSDLLRVDDRTMQTILGEFGTQTLALAIKGASEEITAKILNNVSRRAKDTISEEMELLTSATPSMIAEAQSQFTQVLQRLDEEGQVTL